MNKLRSLICCVLLYFWVVYSFANEAPIKANVTVVATPSVLQPNELVTISGISPLDANGAVKVRITPSGGKPPIDLIATPSKSGDYSINFRGTVSNGEYKIVVTSPGGRITGQGVFTVAVMEPLNEIDEAVQEARLIEAEIKKVAADLDTQIALLPANPEREQLKAKWANLKPLLLQASRDFGDIDSLLAPLPAAARQDASLRPALMPIARKLEDWKTKHVLSESVSAASLLGVGVRMLNVKIWNESKKGSILLRRFLIWLEAYKTRLNQWLLIMSPVK
jgi:hypothetical protein